MPAIPKLKRHPVKLREVYLSKISAQRISNALPAKAPKVEISTDVAYEVVSETSVAGLLTVNAQSADMFDVSVTVRGLFALASKGASDESVINRLIRFVETQAMAILWPYAREAVAGQFSRMGFPPLLLPLINVKETISDLEKQKTTSQS